jgi:4-amino-4-deoxy-L-arabinose transferase-like glycosyltransferase
MSARDPVDKPRWPVRVGLALVAAIYCLYSSFGIAAPFWWGHHGYHGATYMLRARMSLRLHMLSPATWGGYETPPLAALYFHHPIGYHHLLTLLIPIFGDHEWLARGVAVAGGLVALWALYVLVRTFWSREAGLVAVAVYVALPVVTSFSVLSDPMLLAMACVLWSLWAYLSLLERPTTRALWHAFFAYALGGFIMWEAYFIGPFIAVHSIAYAWTRRGKTLRIGRFNALYVHVVVIGAACTLMMAFHIWFTHHAGAWDDFLDSYRIRHSPPSAQYVIDRHVQWIDILYGRPPLIAAAVWFFVWLGRVALGRARRRDLAPLTFLYVNTLYIYMFAEGSSVHLYRVFFYSGLFALCVADLATDAYWVTHRLFRRAPGWLPAAVAASLVGAYLVAEVPHAWRNLLESRVLMGTHGEAHYNPEQQKLRFATEVHARTTRDERVVIHYPHLGARKEFWYYIDRNYDEIQSLQELDKHKPTLGKSVLILDEKMLSAADRLIFDHLIQEHPVTFFDNFTMIDLRSTTPRAQSYSFEPGPMSLAYRFFVSHKYPPLALVRHAYLPGECEALTLGVPVATDEQIVEPTDARLLPCYHDLLVDRGQDAPARAVAEALTKPLTAVDRPLGSARVVAAGLRAGKLEVALAPAGVETGELRYQLSRDGKVGANISASLGIPAPPRWKSGHLYVDHVELPPGRWDVELQLIDPAPAATRKVLVAAPLGTFTR